jgi:glycosyltransferase involved in cell wall biosynthesis
MMSVRLSLIVPTYNRSEYLKKSLPSFLQQSLQSDLYELIVVDNNSNDDTKSVVTQCLASAQCTWRYVFEGQQGLHHARNKGIAEANGDILVFGDDDIIASEQWLESILKEFDCDSRVVIVGGKILPKWDQEPPKWIYDYGTSKTHSLFAYLDYGEERFFLLNEYVFGCNFAITREFAYKIGGSAPDTFPGSLKHLSGSGECAMIDKVRSLGGLVLYCPDAVVMHSACAARATVEYFVDRYERLAVERVFDCFNKMPKSMAARSIVKEVLYTLKNVYHLQINKIIGRKVAHKINLNYYIRIHKKMANKMLVQLARVLVDKSLYKYIIQNNYLKNL